MLLFANNFMLYSRPLLEVDDGAKVRDAPETLERIAAFSPFVLFFLKLVLELHQPGVHSRLFRGELGPDFGQGLFERAVLGDEVVNVRLLLRDHSFEGRRRG